MKIKTRVKIGWYLTLCVLLASGALVVHLNRTLGNLAHQVEDTNKIVDKVSMLGTLTQDYLLYRTERSQRQWLSLFDEIRQLIVDQQSQGLESEYGVEEVAYKLKVMGNTFARLLALREQSDQNPREGEITAELRNRLSTQLLLATRQLVTRFIGLTEEINKKLISTQRFSTSLEILALLLLGGLVISNAIFLQRSVVTPVLKLHEGAEIIGAGNLDYQVGLATPDEIGQLSQAFDRMTANLREITVSRDEMAREIEERRWTEEALRESEARFRSLFEHMAEGVALHELVYDDLGRPVDYRIISVNPAFEKHTGLSPEQIQGQIASSSYGTGAPPYLEEFARVAQTGQAYAFETWFPPMQRHFQVSVTSPKPGQFVTVFEDITPRKQAEETLRQSREDLNRAQAVAHTGSWQLDMRRNELTWSDETYRIFRIPPGTALTYGMFLAAVHPEDREYVDQKWRAALKGEPYNIEHRILAGDEVIWLSEKAELEFDQEGQLVGGFGTVQDITARKQAEERLKKTLDDLARSNKELEEFAYVASHDLQEPLRKMANFSEMLANRYQGQLDERADKYLGYITDGAKRMKELINDLLALSRVGRADFRLLATDMKDVLRGALNDIQPLIREKQAEITHGPLPALKVNSPQMRQLLQNLITNAIKFHGDQSPRIHLSARQDGHEWIMAVQDQGIGFAPQYAGRIFEVFQRLHSKEEYPGTGIGLAICKKIVERHGGRIWAESEPGQGSTFYFTIPA